MKNQFIRFIEDLSKVKLPINVFNPYSYDYDENLLKRKNLFLYLQQMAKLNPHVLLVGEAPGYRGCRLTGVPFTSEFILLNGIDEIGLFGKLRDYQKTNEFEKVWKEQEYGHGARCAFEVTKECKTTLLQEAIMKNYDNLVEILLNMNVDVTINLTCKHYKSIFDYIEDISKETSKNFFLSLS